MRRVLAPALITSLTLGLVLAFLTPFTGRGEGSKLEAVVTIPPQEFLVQSIGGNKVSVTSMVPEDGSPHSASLTSDKLKIVKGADLYFKIGLPLPFEQNNMSVLLQENTEIIVVDTSQGVDKKTLNEHYQLRGEEETVGEDSRAFDPHIWMSPANLKTMAQNIYVGLSKISPSAKDHFQDNLERLLSKITQTQERVEKILQPFEGRSFIAYHPAWGYFGDEYNLHQVAVEENGKEPGPKQIRDIARFAEDRGINEIIASSQFHPSMAKTVARVFGGSITTINPLSENPLDEILKLAQAIASGYESVEKSS
ncbi:MAG: metal ABC transporter solute-binding protein, Zn/Mn family [Candidatus Bipolaricaulota bacterium]